MEALVSALTEELEDIADDTESAKRSEPLHAVPSAFSEEEAGLVELLKSMQRECTHTGFSSRLLHIYHIYFIDLRPPSAPPLVLLNKEDLKNEIDTITQQSRAAYKKEMQWASELSRQLLSLYAYLFTLHYDKLELTSFRFQELITMLLCYQQFTLILLSTHLRHLSHLTTSR